VNAGCAEGMFVVGKIAFNPKEVLGRGSEGTFVYRSVLVIHAMQHVNTMTHTHTHTTILRPFFRDHPSEPVPEENSWTLWCKGRLTEADTPTIRLGATLSGVTSAPLHNPPHFFTGRMPFLPPNQHCQSTEGTAIL